MRYLFTVLLLVSSISKAVPKATIETSLGTINIVFLESQAPKTVENFIKLATGEQKHIDINGKKSSKPFYDGLKIHRVHPELGIFSGCPFGTGRGWPGFYTSDDESSQSQFGEEGLVAMAKIVGDSRVGSQFFITVKPEPRFNGKYSAFAKVTSGMDIVKKIATVPHSITLTPEQPIFIKKIQITR